MDLDRIVDYYSGQLSPEEEAAVQQWLVAHADDPEVSSILESLFSAAPESADESAVASIFGRLKTRLHMGSARRLRLWPLAAAATVTSVFCLFLGYRAGKGAAVEPQPVVEWVEKIVPAGTTEQLVLPDSSVLLLKAGTRLVYPSAFDGPERLVFLDGEVYADIARDPSRPFRISAGDTQVQVLGTRFNLKSSSALRQVEALLLEGSIRMDLSGRTGTRRVQLQPGNLLQFDRKTGDLGVTDVDPDFFGACSSGRYLFFNNEPMEDIAIDLSRRFGEKVMVTDEALARSHYFAIFSNDETLDEILSAMNKDGRMRVSRRDGVVYLQSSNNTNK